MEIDTESSNIRLASNIMLKSKYERDPWSYIPVDLLPPYYCDVRAFRFLSPSQRKQVEKKAFLANSIIDEE